jgi:hypothetical protein
LPAPDPDDTAGNVVDAPKSSASANTSTKAKK